MPADHGAFVPGPRARLAATGAGALDGLTFAAKDNIDVAGVVSGAGNPDWRAAARPAAMSASCVSALLGAGAALVGKTVSDELAFSLEGRNAFDGTPVNPVCPDRLPGGSSSGSAVAVAAGLADFALGTDTGGSVRVPASFCGILGFRPTHGRVPVDGVVPLACSYDTVGWFARDAAVLAAVGDVLLGPAPSPVEPVRRVLLAEDAFDMADAAMRSRLLEAARGLGVEVSGGISLFERDQALFLECYRVLQGAEIWRRFGPWIERCAPRFAHDIAARFRDAAGIGAKQVAGMALVQRRIAGRLKAMLQPGTVILLPAAPCCAPLLDAGADEIGAFYRKALALTSVAGHGGLPQVAIPSEAAAGECPIGLSVLGWRGGDEALLGLVGQAGR